MCDIRIVDLTRRCRPKPSVFAFYICWFVLVNKHIIYLWCNISWEVSNSSFECRIRSRDPGHAHLGSFYGPDAVGVRHLCLCQIWSRYLYSFQSYSLRGVPKFPNLVTWPRLRPLRGHFMVRTPEGCVVDVCTKFEADSSIRSKLGHATLSHAPFVP